MKGSIVFSGGTGLGAPEGSENVTIVLADVSIGGGYPQLSAETAELRERLTGGEIPVSDIFLAAAKLEDDYAAAGFVLVRVVIPQQSLEDGGTLQLSIVDGFIESVDAAEVPARVRERIVGIMAPLINRPGVTRAEIERRLLIAGDTYGVALGSAVAAGATPGGTVIVLSPRYQSITGFIGADNRSSAALGNWNVDVGVELNGFLGWGEVFYGRASFHPDSDLFSGGAKSRSGAIGVVTPIGDDGLSLNLELTGSETNPTAAVGSHSVFTRQSVRLVYPWVRSIRRNITTELAVDVISDRLELTDTNARQHHDKTRVLRGSVDAFFVLDETSSLEVGGRVSIGFDAFGAGTGRADAAHSRLGADTQFIALQASSRYRTQVTENVRLTLNGRAQTSFGDPLVDSERFGIAGARDLSVFDDGAIDGDYGWVARGELSYPVAIDVENGGLQLSPYAFAAAGQVFNEAPEPGEDSSITAAGAGFGLELLQVRDPDYSNASVRFEVGYGARNDGEEDGIRVSVGGTFRF